MPLILALEWQADLCKFQTSLVETPAWFTDMTADVKSSWTQASYLYTASFLHLVFMMLSAEGTAVHYPSLDC